MRPSEFATRHRMRLACGPDGCTTGRCCIFSRMGGALDAGGGKEGRQWVCDHPDAREPGPEQNGGMRADACQYIPASGKNSRAGSSNVLVSYRPEGDTICDAFVPLGTDAPGVEGPIADALRVLRRAGREGAQ